MRPTNQFLPRASCIPTEFRYRKHWVPSPDSLSKDLYSQVLKIIELNILISFLVYFTLTISICLCLSQVATDLDWVLCYSLEVDNKNKPLCNVDSSFQGRLSTTDAKFKEINDKLMGKRPSYWKKDRELAILKHQFENFAKELDDLKVAYEREIKRTC